MTKEITINGVVVNGCKFFIPKYCRCSAHDESCCLYPNCDHKMRLEYVKELWEIREIIFKQNRRKKYEDFPKYHRQILEIMMRERNE